MMSNTAAGGRAGMPRGFYWLICAQFFSGLADNTLLIVAIGFLQDQGYPAWWAPLLKFSSTWAYVLLAPIVGHLADGVPKGALMGWMNAVKLAGAASLLAGLHPLLAFAVIGVGAAAYAPAKYGLITETVAPSRLVSANGWIEVSVVLSVLLGTGLGGLLISQHAAGWIAATQSCFAMGSQPSRLAGAIGLVLGLYVIAALLNWGVPRRPPRQAANSLRLDSLLSDFSCANRQLWRDPLGGLSLAVTTLFWGAGAVLQFAVLSWSVDSLGLTLDRAAYLQACVAFGVVLGAGLAAHRISLLRAPAMLPWGIAMGLLVAGCAQMTSVEWALPLMLATGAVGGLLVVPMNALLQYRGHRLLSPGRSIAVQGFNENLSVLVMLGIFALLQRGGLPIVPLMAGFGLLVATGIAGLRIRFRLARGSD
jgi:hypothetical protein